MRTTITTLDIQNEMDIVLAHRRAMQIGKFAGINISEQTRFATAVSEICRNTLEYCKGGDIDFGICLSGDADYSIEAIITDCGPGISDLDNILKRSPQTHKGKGRGIVFSRKLVDAFKIVSNARGTKVILGLDVPQNAAPINKLIIQSWINHIKKEPPLTAYEELKIRNANLMQLTEELKTEKQKTDKHLGEIEKLNDILQKTNDNMEEFTYTVSHDLKTPLTSIKLSLEFLNEEQDPDEKIQYIEIISRAARRLERTVQGLVEILDVQVKNKSIVKHIYLEDFFEDILEGFATLTDSKNITIEHSFMIGEINYIEPYLNSIFINLINNSIKYRQPDIPLHINISSRRKGGIILLTFTDNGEGIDLEKNGKRLFTPFTRFSSQADGKGIGLYLIKKMVEKNDGRIEIESEPGKGTTFRIYLKEYPVPAVTT